MKKFIALFLIVFIFANNLGVLAQRKVQTEPTPPKVIELESTNPVENFSEKGLPVPYRIGEMPSDKLAAELAKEILKYDEKSLSVLTATLQKAGFYIMDSNQKTLYQPADTEDNTGMAFYDFEVVGMLKASSLGIGLSVKKFAEVVSENGKDVPADVMAEWVLQSLYDAKSSKDPRTRFTINLIFEIGKQFPVPLDLMTTSPENSKLNLIQASLIERVMLGDILNGYASLPQENSLLQKLNLFNSNEIRFINTKFRSKNVSPCDQIKEISDFQKAEKLIKKGVDKVADSSSIFKPEAIGKSSLKGPFQQLNVLDKYKNVAKGIKIANVVLAWAKLVLSLNLIEIKMNMQAPPLRRTQSNLNKNRGETKQVSATISMKGLSKENKELLDCVGKAVETTTGLKTSLPKEGPLANKPVIWELLSKGGVETKFTSLPVELGSADNKGSNRQKTDANGETKIDVIGKVQKENLEDKPVVPIIKRVPLRVNVSPEEMKKDDIGKIGKVGLEAWGLNLFLGILEVLPEMVNKLPIVSKTIEIPVRDWIPCSQDWGGEIQYKREYNPPAVYADLGRKPNGNGLGKGSRRISEFETVQITLNPRTVEEMETKPPNPAELIVNGKYYEFFSGKTEADPCCESLEGNFATTFERTRDEEFSAFVERPLALFDTGSKREYSQKFSLNADSSGFFFLMYSGGEQERNFSIQLNLFAGVFDTDIRITNEIKESSCPWEKENAKPEYRKGRRKISDTLEPGRYGERRIDSTGEILVGTKNLNKPDGSIVSWEWQLARCTK